MKTSTYVLGLILCMFMQGALGTECDICYSINDYIQREINRQVSNVLERIAGVENATSYNKHILEHLSQTLISTTPGWYTPFNGYQYIVLNNKNWADARSACQELGGDLAVYGVQDYDTRLIIANTLLKPHSISYTWIGLSDIAEEGNWIWVDGLPADNAHWNRHQPDDSQGKQDCGAIWTESKGYRTDDGNCNHETHALCEKQIIHY